MSQHFLTLTQQNCEMCTDENLENLNQLTQILGHESFYFDHPFHGLTSDGYKRKRFDSW